MMFLPWWAIVIILIIIFMVVLIVRGWIIARRCRKIFRKENENLPTNHDEDSESGGSDTNS